MATVALVSLGCAKNLIDSEIMIGHLQKAGVALTPHPELADAVIINTCSFIDNAKKESIEAVFEVIEQRMEDPTRKRQKLIVAGCLSQRFAKDLPRLMPEVDAFVGLDQITRIPQILVDVLGLKEGEEGNRDYVSRAPKYIPDYDTPRYRLTPRHTAYIKIAEGCNHPCSFCIIPQIRGHHRSRTLASVVNEARILIREGVREINLISQDTTYFGMDRWEAARAKPNSPVDSSKGESIADLLRALNALEGDFWVRLLYTHPAHWSDELIQTIAECDKVVKYVDIPLQHISDPMLAKMRRETDRAHIENLLSRMRRGIPGLAIRTAFIVGFPGETQEDFDQLLAFIESSRFERMGVFQYSREEGTNAYRLDSQVHPMRRKSRWSRAMALQSRINAEISAAQVGKTIRVIVDSPGKARSWMDAPEVDGVVHVDPSLAVGSFVDVVIQEARGYDLIATGAQVGSD